MTAPNPGFQPGRSGNPSGRPKGSRNRSTLALEAIFEGESEALSRKAIALALAGDGPAMKLYLDRLLAPRRDRSITFDLPPIATAADLPRATEAMLRAVSSGEITPSEAADIGKAVSAHIEAITAADLHRRRPAPPHRRDRGFAAMRLRDLEARVLKLERDPENTRLARMSEEELDARIIDLMNRLAADHPTYDALIDELAAMPEHDMQEAAKNMRSFLDDHLSRRARQPAQ